MLCELLLNEIVFCNKHSYQHIVTVIKSSLFRLIRKVLEIKAVLAG